MHLPQPKLFISLSELNSVDFPMISYTISELVNFSKMIIDANPERRAIGKAFNLSKLILLISENYLITAYHNFTHAFSLLLVSPHPLSSSSSPTDDVPTSAPSSQKNSGSTSSSQP